MTKAEEILGRMTLEEKAALSIGATAWTTTPIDRLGLPALTMSDGPHGVRRTPEAGSMQIEALPATCFPTASCASATWDVESVRELGRAVAEEANALGVDVVLGPGVNMKRTPLCGRNFEYFSEDPFLAGELAVAWIDGIQSLGVGASLKHFAANNQETRRMTVSSEVDERTLRELYLPAFEAAVTRAKPWTVMCCYNRVNGTHGSEHRHLLTEILRDEWGFDGLTVSDWGAVHDRPKALAAGLELEMPGPRPRRVQAVVEAVRSGSLDEAALDRAALRIIRTALRAAETKKGAPLDSDAHHALARRIAARGMVLLKNDGILPLAPGGRIAVIGHAAQEPHFQGGGSSHMTTTKVDIPIEELKRLAGKATITFAEGYPADETARPDLIAAAVADARAADVALLYVALPTYKENEGSDRADLDLTAQQVALIQAVTAAQPRSVVILFNGSAVAMSAWVDGAAAVLEAWMAGQASGGAVADLLFGAVNPSGKLAETFPLRLEDTPAFLNHPGEDDRVRYGEGLFIGYRWYDATRKQVLFPFGFGLSYTNFAYGQPRVSTAEFDDTAGVTVSVDVTNSGKVAGDEIVQVYVHDHAAGLVRPEKELKGFARIHLEPGETRTVAIPLGFRAFAFYHPGHGRWVTEDGQFDLLVGASSADIRGTATVTLHSTADLPSLLTVASPPADWLADKRGGPLAVALMAELLPVLRRALGKQAQEGIEAFDPGLLNFLMYMPLVDVLEFAAALGGPDPEAVASRLEAGLAAPAS
jgi:beta-glucosidase